MYVAVFPPVPSQALTGAILTAGHTPVPFESPADLAAKSPKHGFAVAVIEVGEDIGLALGTGSKVGDDQGIPVLLVTDRTRTADLRDESGFDDFMLSPIDPVELGIRLHRLTGHQPVETEPEVLVHEDLELNTATYQATVGGRPRDLTYMEYELLRFFVEHPGRVWSREQILSKVWGYDYFGGSRTVDVHVRRLRAKLGEERAPWITTVRSVGYRFG